MSKKYDGLTGLYTREQVMTCAEELLTKAAESKTPLSVILLDLDNFKDFNDHFGLPLGDELIINFAKTLKANCRKEDLVGRYGGEEFLMVMPDTLAEEALIMLEDLLRQVSNSATPLKSAEHSIEHKYSFSGGIAALPRDGGTLEELLISADKALYRSKINGRNRISVAINLPKAS